MTVPIFKICAPGTRLPENECVYLTAELFGVVRRTNFIIPCFPLSFDDILLFEKIFIFERHIENIFIMFQDATIEFALYQTSNVSHDGKLLAYYKESAFSVLFKSCKYSGTSYVSNQEIFLRRTVHFPGPLPRMRLRTVTLIEGEVLEESEGSSETVHANVCHGPSRISRRSLMQKKYLIPTKCSQESTARLLESAAALQNNRPGPCQCISDTPLHIKLPQPDHPSSLSTSSLKMTEAGTACKHSDQRLDSDLTKRWCIPSLSSAGMSLDYSRDDYRQMKMHKLTCLMYEIWHLFYPTRNSTCSWNSPPARSCEFPCCSWMDTNVITSATTNLSAKNIRNKSCFECAKCLAEIAEQKFEYGDKLKLFSAFTTLLLMEEGQLDMLEIPTITANRIKSTSVCDNYCKACINHSPKAGVSKICVLPSSVMKPQSKSEYKPGFSYSLTNGSDFFQNEPPKNKVYSSVRKMEPNFAKLSSVDLSSFRKWQRAKDASHLISKMSSSQSQPSLNYFPHTVPASTSVPPKQPNELKKDRVYLMNSVLTGVVEQMPDESRYVRVENSTADKSSPKTSKLSIQHRQTGFPKTANSTSLSSRVYLPMKSAHVASRKEGSVTRRSFDCSERSEECVSGVALSENQTDTVSPIALSMNLCLIRQLPRDINIERPLNFPNTNYYPLDADLFKMNKLKTVITKEEYSLSSTDFAVNTCDMEYSQEARLVKHEKTHFDKHNIIDQTVQNISSEEFEYSIRMEANSATASFNEECDTQESSTEVTVQPNEQVNLHKENPELVDEELVHMGFSDKRDITMIAIPRLRNCESSCTSLVPNSYRDKPEKESDRHCPHLGIEAPYLIPVVNATSLPSASWQANDLKLLSISQVAQKHTDKESKSVSENSFSQHCSSGSRQVEKYASSIDKSTDAVQTTADLSVRLLASTDLCLHSRTLSTAMPNSSHINRYIMNEMLDTKSNETVELLNSPPPLLNLKLAINSRSTSEENVKNPQLNFTYEKCGIEYVVPKVPNLNKNHEKNKSSDSERDWSKSGSQNGLSGFRKQFGERILPSFNLAVTDDMADGRPSASSRLAPAPKTEMYPDIVMDQHKSTSDTQSYYGPKTINVAPLTEPNRKYHHNRGTREETVSDLLVNQISSTKFVSNADPEMNRQNLIAPQEVSTTGKMGNLTKPLSIHLPYVRCKSTTKEHMQHVTRTITTTKSVPDKQTGNQTRFVLPKRSCSQFSPCFTTVDACVCHKSASYKSARRLHGFGRKHCHSGCRPLIVLNLVPCSLRSRSRCSTYTQTTLPDPSTACLTHPDVTLITDKEVDKEDPGCSIHGTADRASVDTGFTCGAHFKYALANRSQPVQNCSRYSTVYAADRQRIPSIRLIMTSEQYQHMKDVHDFQGGTLVETSCCDRTKIRSPDTESHNVLLHGPTGAPRKTMRKSFRKKVSRGRSRSRSKKQLLSNLRKLVRSKINSSDLTSQLVSMLNSSSLRSQAKDLQFTDPQLLKMCEKQNEELAISNCDKSEAVSGITPSKQHTAVSKSIIKPIRNLGLRESIIHALKSHRIHFQSGLA
ncbi:hypothetical protein EG68_08377 [Paragonimus skrjabini miyazakii]|uniref:Spermatogenesis-associated protein 6 N-terminal domain-containing protein n=1 Tax=Paragonimus skrjabini miyazakii TaxID=59628 RepID=A0A8S9YPJ4_9TREM|nr:hypothetical protein EG68_08377 [Paragonimus skrjabini miyazakii]